MAVQIHPSSPWNKMEMCGQYHAPAALPAGRLGAPESRSSRCRDEERAWLYYEDSPQIRNLSTP